MTDAELIHACLRREPAAEKRFYERFSRLGMGICRRYAADRAEAEDMLQDALVRAFFQLKTFEAKGSLEGWVRRVVVNTCLEELRRTRRLRLQESLDPELPLAAPDSNAFLEEADAAHLVAAISALPEGPRVVFNLYAVEGYSHAEIGQMLRISESTSRVQLTRARAQLRHKLARGPVPTHTP